MHITKGHDRKSYHRNNVQQTLSAINFMCYDRLSDVKYNVSLSLVTIASSVAMMFMTSEASTGKPKAVAHCHSILTTMNCVAPLMTLTTVDVPESGCRDSARSIVWHVRSSCSFFAGPNRDLLDTGLVLFIVWRGSTCETFGECPSRCGCRREKTREAELG